LREKEGEGERERGREEGGNWPFWKIALFLLPPSLPLSLSLSLSLSHFTAPFLIFLPSSFQHVVLVVVVVLDLVAAAVLVVGVDPASPGAPG
jgi:hypothetical protein